MKINAHIAGRSSQEKLEEDIATSKILNKKKQGGAPH